jgi:small subunit ribosomal protein S15
MMVAKGIHMLDKQKKEEIIKKYRIHKGDTGSSEVQIAILTAEIEELTNHLKRHKKDFSSRKGLIKKVIQRKRLLRYLEKENAVSYVKLTKKLGIKMTPLNDIEDEQEGDFLRNDTEVEEVSETEGDNVL